MQRLLVLAPLLAACWTAPVVERDLKPPKVLKHLRVPPTCWSTEFYEQWPAQVWLWELTRQCEAEWSEYGEIATCVAVTIDREYQQLWWWVLRWFESCDPARH